MIWVLACVRGPGADGVVAADFAPRPQILEYTAWEDTGDGPVETSVRVTYTAVEGAAHCDGQAFQGHSVQDGQASWTRLCVSDGRWGYVGMREPGATEWREYPMEPVLRDGQVIGEAWRTDMDGDAQRDCTLEKTPFCRQGVATDCVTRFEDGLVWLRQHYCPDLSLVAFDARVWREGQLTLESWSQDTHIDGEPVGPVGRSRRPMPELAD